MKEMEKHLKEISDYINKGYSYSWIARKLDFDKGTVRKFCIKHDIRSKHKMMKKDRKYTQGQVKKLYIDNNLTVYEVADKLQITVSELKSYIYENGLTKCVKKKYETKLVDYDATKPDRIVIKINKGQVLKLNIMKKGIEDEVIKAKESYKVIDIYPHCVLLAKVIKGKVNMNLRMCPGLWDLNRMMG